MIAIPRCLAAALCTRATTGRNGGSALRALVRGAKVAVSSLRKGTLLSGAVVDGGNRKHIMRVLETTHVKPGKGVAYIQAKLRNIDTNGTHVCRYRSAETIDVLDLDDEKAYQYLYEVRCPHRTHLAPHARHRTPFIARLASHRTCIARHRTPRLAFASHRTAPHASHRTTRTARRSV